MEKEIIKPAIVLVNYNRPDCTKRLLQTVVDADYLYTDIPLVISIDNSDKSDEIAEIVSEFDWKYGKKIIVKHSERLGLKKHILECGELSEKYGAVIVLEDDLYVSNNFYQYAVQALSHYDKDKRIAGVSLYTHSWNGYGNCFFSPQRSEFDTFFGQFSITWGECWTKEQFRQFKAWLNDNSEFEDDLLLPKDVNTWGPKSWGRLFFRYIVKNNLYYVIPYNSFLTNFSNAGEHNDGISSAHQVVLDESKKDRTFVFPSFEEGVWYDSFFDREFKAQDTINGIPGNKICVDLNHCKRVSINKSYLLTDIRYKKLKKVQSYSLCLRPIEKNALDGIIGSDFYLYELPAVDTYRLKNKKMSKFRMAYELYGFRWNGLIGAGVSSFFKKVRNKLKRIFK